MNFRLARDGHLLDVDVDALLRDDLDRSLRAQVEDHARDCIGCRRRVDKAREEYRTPLPSRPSAPTAAEAPPPRARTPKAPPEPALPAASPSLPATPAFTPVPPSSPQRLPAASPPTPATPPPAESQAPINLNVANARQLRSWDAPKSAPARTPPTKAKADADNIPAWKRHGPTALLIAGAMALLVVAASGGSDEGTTAAPAAPVEFRLSVSRERGGKPELLLDSASAQIGDELSFQVTLPKASPLLLLSINASGTVTPHFPAKVGDAGMVQAGTSSLPVTLTLGGNPGIDRFIALACANGMSVSDASVLALGVPESGKVPPMYPGCHQSIVRLRKLL